MSNPLQDKLNTLDMEAVANLYKRLFNSEEGQLVLEDLKNCCFCKITSFTWHDSEINFNEGKRAVVLHIESMIDFKPEPEDASAP